jgi:putative endonuclease
MAHPDRGELGRSAEDLAVTHLETSGVQILLRNFRRRTGELDIIALQGSTLLVIEVRLRSRADYGGAAASVDAIKQRKIIRTTEQLLQTHRALARWPVRFDVVVVTPTSSGPTSPGAPLERSGTWQVEWIRHAFQSQR